MKVIGLCGKSGSGKGFVSNVFDEFGVKSIDTDSVYHDLISRDSDCTRELIDYFGPSVASSKGIDRKKLKDIVFSSPNDLCALNKITHKHILASVRELIEKMRSDASIKGVLIDAPLLFESGFDSECDLTVCVISDEKLRINRIIARDNITYDDALKRVKTQLSDDYLIERCDYSIVNNSTEDELRASVQELVNKIFK